MMIIGGFPGNGCLRLFVVLFSFAIFVLSVQLHAQNLTGEIDGTVRDSAGAVIPNASVTVKDSGQNIVVRTLMTDGQGQFVAPALATGNYLVTVGAVGFETSTVSGIAVDVNQHTPIQIALQPGQASQTVTVTASSIAPQTQTSAAGTLLSGTQVQQLSLSGRNYQQLITLQPGVTGVVPTGTNRGGIAASGQTAASPYSVSGLSTSQNGYFVDGEDILNHGGSAQTSVFPSIDAIQEMNLLRSDFGAQYGGQGSAIISMQSRSGTSALHGGAFEFFRSEILNANNYFNNLAHIARPGIRYNDYGYDVGGPVWIPHVMDRQNPKTFFFFLQEFLREETQSGETLTNIPTAAQREGIFNAPVCVQNTNGKCTKSATSISQFDPTAQAYLKDIINKTPLPNNPNDPQGLIASETGFKNETQTVIRIDHQFSQKLSVFFRYLDDPFHLVVPNGLYSATGIPGVGLSNVTNGGTDYMGHAAFTLGPNTVFEGGYAYTPGWITALPIGLAAKSSSPDITPTLPYPSTLGTVPHLNINGSFYGAFGPYVNPAHTSQAFLNVVHTMGRHTFYFGGNYENEVNGSNAGSANAGEFIFQAGILPAGSAATQFDQSFANFLQGKVTSFLQTSIDSAVLIHTNLYEGYFQDDFHANSRLTLNWGVRYTFIQQPTAGPLLGQSLPLSNFDPNLFNPADAPTIGSNGAICTVAPCAGGGTPNGSYNPLNGIIIAGKTSPYGGTVNSQPNLTFAPRVGFAWDIHGDGRLALRGGYGIYYAQIASGPYNSEVQVNPPYVNNTQIPNTSFGDPGGGVPASSPFPRVVNANETDWSIPYTQSWSLDLQQQVGANSLLDIGYYGNRATHLVGSEDINQPFPGEYAQKSIIPGNHLTPGNSVLLNQIRPYLGWGSIDSNIPGFFSDYHSLQTSITKRFSDGGTLNVNYTWSKALTDAILRPQNIYNLRAEYGPAPFNRTNVLSADFVYILPFLRAQRGIVGHALGGWETTGIVTYGSGLSSTAFTINVDPGGLGLLAPGGAGARPDAVSNPNSNAPHNLHQWFNTAAFAQVPAGEYRPGNAPVNNIIGPGYEVWNLSLFKNFQLTNSSVMQFRAESFNTFNHTNFNGVATTLGLSNYGQVTTAGNARILQLAAKIRF